MWRLTDRMVRSTLVTACRLATSPTRTSPDLANATTEGVVRAPSALAMTVGSPPSRTATTEFVVPRSMPTARAMGYLRYIAPRAPRVVGREGLVCGHPAAGAASVANKLSPINSTLLICANGGGVEFIPCRVQGWGHDRSDPHPQR